MRFMLREVTIRWLVADPVRISSTSIERRRRLTKLLNLHSERFATLVDAFYDLMLRKTSFRGLCDAISQSDSFGAEPKAK